MRMEEDHPTFSSVAAPPTKTLLTIHNDPSCATAPPAAASNDKHHHVTKGDDDETTKQQQDNGISVDVEGRNSHEKRRREDTTKKKNLKKKALDLERNLLQKFCRLEEEILRQNYRAAVCSSSAGRDHDEHHSFIDSEQKKAFDSDNEGSSAFLSTSIDDVSLSSAAAAAAAPDFSSTNKVSFTLITGPSGSYRIAQRALSTLVQEHDKGYFLYTKFEEQGGPMLPYHGWCDIITDWIHRIIVHRNKDEKNNGGPNPIIRSSLASISDTLRSTLAKRDRESLARMIPSLADLLVVPLPEEATINNNNKQQQQSNNKKNKKTRTTAKTAGFVQAASNLVETLGREFPLVIVLDDLQFADKGSIEILLHIVVMKSQQQKRSERREPANKFMIIGAFDDSLMSSSSEEEELRLTQLKNVAAASHTLSAPRLSKEQLDTLLWETCRLEVEERKAFADLAMQQTHEGYVFELIHFFHWALTEAELLSQNTTTWSESYKLAPTTTTTTGGSSNFEIFFERLRYGTRFPALRIATLLPQPLQQLLQVASCLGSSFTQSLLELVAVEDRLVVEQKLEELIRFKMLQRAPDYSTPDQDMYVFEPGVQRLAYQMMSEQHRKEVHHRIGRCLWASVLGNDTELDEKLFDILSHLYMGGQQLLIVGTAEEAEQSMSVVDVASLCHRAGEKAVRASAFQTSALYLKFGIDILPARHWEKPQTYDLSLALYSAAAEVYTSSQATNYQEVERLLAVVLSKARANGEKVQANSSLMYVYTLQGKQIDCLDLGITVLKGLGLTFPKSLSKVFLLPDMIAASKLIGNKTNAQIMDMPRMTNKKKLMTLQILHHMILPSILCRPKLTPFVLLKMAVITLKFGLSVFSSLSFGVYGMFRIKAAGDVRLATRFQEMSKILLERFGADEYLPRTYVAIYGCTHAFSRPPSESLEPLMQAHNIGKSLGDVEYSGLAYTLYLLHVMEGGLSLKFFHEFRPLFLQMSGDPFRHTLMRLAQPGAECLDRWCGNLSDPFARRGNFIDFEEYNQEAIACGSVQNQIELRYRKMQLGYIFRDFELAEEACLKLSDVEEFAPTCQLIGVTFWIGLVRIHAAQNGRRRIRNILLTRRVCKRLTKWAEHAPHNVLDRKSLLQAELAAAVGDKERALEKYRLAVLCTESSKNLMIRALANERMGRYVLANYDLVEARVHFTEALKAYQDWGADAKATRLQDEMIAHFGPIDDDE